MTKFKVGDRIEKTRPSLGSEYVPVKGHRATVVRVGPEGTFIIYRGHEFPIWTASWQLVRETVPRPFEVGDMVTRVSASNAPHWAFPVGKSCKVIGIGPSGQLGFQHPQVAAWSPIWSDAVDWEHTPITTPDPVPTAGKSDGGTTSYYKLPEDAVELQDLIEAREMNFAVANIFKASYRLGKKDGNTRAYDLRKIIWFAQRELDRCE